MYRGSVAAGFELHWYKLYIQPCRICLMVDWELDASNKKILMKIPFVKPNRKLIYSFPRYSNRNARV